MGAPSTYQYHISPKIWVQSFTFCILLFKSDCFTFSFWYLYFILLFYIWMLFNLFCYSFAYTSIRYRVYMCIYNCWYVITFTLLFMYIIVYTLSGIPPPPCCLLYTRHTLIYCMPHIASPYPCAYTHIHILHSIFVIYIWFNKRLYSITLVCVSGYTHW